MQDLLITASMVSVLIEAYSHLCFLFNLVKIHVNGDGLRRISMIYVVKF